MAQTYSEHLEQGIRTAQNKFIDFVYDYSKHKNIESINWHNKSGCRDYQIIFLYDNDCGVLSVYGDLGDAIYHFGEGRLLEDVASAKVFEYFESKFVCGTERYQFDEEYAKCQLKERLRYNSSSDSERKSLDSLIRYFLYACDDEGYKNSCDNELPECLWKEDPDYEKWVYTIGLLPHTRHILYWQALAQIYGKGNCKNGK